MKFYATVSLIILYLAVNAPVVSADDNLWDQFKNLDIFKIRDGSLACPLPVVGQACPEGTAFYYFRCCGDIHSNCCIRLQDWLLGLIALSIVLMIVGIIANLLRCIFCPHRTY